MSSTNYTGLLKPKRKSELQDISKALGLAVEGTKDSLESAIESALSTSESLRNDIRFSGLWKPITEKRGSGERQVSISSRAQRALGAVEHETERALVNVDKETRQVAERVNSLITRTVTKHVGEARAVVQHATAATQAELSNGWRLVSLTVWAELLFVLLTHTHYHRKYSFGPSKWTLFPLPGTHAYSISLPNYTIWYSRSFITPFVLWILSTVVLPFLFASVIVFPRPEVSNRRSKSRHARPEPASALTFSIARVAVSFFLLRIAPFGLSSSWNQLTQFGDFQLLCSSVGLAFSAYEAFSI